MSHKHHSCQCDHANVKFCKPCQLVHCLDCSKEWRQATNWNTLPYYLGQAKLTTVSAPSVWTTNQNTLKDGHTLTVTSTANDLTPLTKTACDHKG